MNAAIVLQLLIQGTEQLMKLQSLLATANAEGRDVTEEELNGLSDTLGDKIAALRAMTK